MNRLDIARIIGDLEAINSRLAALLTETAPRECAHSHSCFVNTDGYTQCPCGAVIYEEMGG